jgi:hypothetical protein
MRFAQQKGRGNIPRPHFYDARKGARRILSRNLRFSPIRCILYFEGEKRR